MLKIILEEEEEEEEEEDRSANRVWICAAAAELMMMIMMMMTFCLKSNTYPVCFPYCCFFLSCHRIDSIVVKILVHERGGGGG